MKGGLKLWADFVREADNVCRWQFAFNHVQADSFSLQPVPFRIPDNARYQQQQQQSESQYDENDDTLRKGKRSLEQ